jgi:hypothetical protein
VDFDVRERSHYLLLRRKIGALLEFEVANGTRQGEVAVDAAKIDEAACSLDTGLLGCEMSVESVGVGGELAFVLRLVVEGERLGASLDTEDSS